MPKIYTKTGDKGTSMLYDGSRKSKTDIIFEVLGENDELSARVGMLISYVSDMKESDIFVDILRGIQGTLQVINSNIATINPEKKKNVQKINEDVVKDIEDFIDEMQNILPKLTKFILPGVSPADGQAHLCRTQARKAERMVWTLNTNDVQIDSVILQYMNRLSDFFFVLARVICMKLGKEDAFM